MSQIKVLVSACLLGSPVRYDGGANPIENQILEDWRSAGIVVSICPEVLGSLPVPRPAAEIVGGDGRDVLDGTAVLRTNDSADVTNAFIAGATAALDIAIKTDAKIAVLKARSPSCGSTEIYDGSFSKTKKPGMGVTAALFAEHGIALFNETQLVEAEQARVALCELHQTS